MIFHKVVSLIFAIQSALAEARKKCVREHCLISILFYSNYLTSVLNNEDVKIPSVWYAVAFKKNKVVNKD